MPSVLRAKTALTWRYAGRSSAAKGYRQATSALNYGLIRGRETSAEELETMKTLNYGLAVGVVGLLLGSPLNAGYVEEVLRDGPVAYWRLGEADLDAPLVELTGNVSDGFFEPFGAGLEVGFPAPS